MCSDGNMQLAGLRLRRPRRRRLSPELSLLGSDSKGGLGEVSRGSNCKTQQLEGASAKGPVWFQRAMNSSVGIFYA